MLRLKFISKVFALSFACCNLRKVHFKQPRRSAVMNTMNSDQLTSVCVHLLVNAPINWKHVEHFASFIVICGSLESSPESQVQASESRGNTDYWGQLILLGGKQIITVCASACLCRSVCLCRLGGWGGVLCTANEMVKDAFPATLARYISWEIGATKKKSCKILTLLPWQPLASGISSMDSWGKHVKIQFQVYNNCNVYH